MANSSIGVSIPNKYLKGKKDMPLTSSTHPLQDPCENMKVKKCVDPYLFSTVVVVGDPDITVFIPLVLQGVVFSKLHTLGTRFETTFLYSDVY